MKLKRGLKIGDIEVEYPIIQGGMGVGISMSNLASAVTLNGGIGVIASAACGLELLGIDDDLKNADERVLYDQIKQAKELCGDMPVGVNIMGAVNNYESMVKVSIEAGADIIITGAGLPLNLPEIAGDSGVKLVPIVSSARAADLIMKVWDKRYSRMPDAIVIEGPLAGGHLGFSEKDLISKSVPSIEDLLKDVKAIVEAWEYKYSIKIPIIVAGGIYRGWEIKKMLELGADGVQMATRFVATFECDAHENFKKAYVDATRDDVIIIKSPVGMPARALRNTFVERMLKGDKQPIRCFYRCLKPCKPSEVPYCIAEALIKAKRGDTEDGLIFCGERVYEVDEILTVSDLFKALEEEFARE